MGNMLPGIDLAAKKFWRDNCRFADLFNAVFFRGDQVIDPKLLTERDTEVSEPVQLKKTYEHVKRTEDVTKYYQGTELVILGVENQSKIHYAMPLRNRTYEDLDYLKELTALTKENKSLGELLTTEEYLSGIKKDDKIHMSLRIVIYYGEKNWDGPTRLSEMMIIPDIFRPFFQDYEIPLISVGDPQNANLPYKEEEVRKIMTLIPLIYQGNWEEIMKKDLEMKKDSAELIASVTGNKQLHDLARKAKKEGNVRMCTSLENLKEQYLEEGKLAGKAEGLEEGKLAGKAEGLEEGKLAGKAEGLEEKSLDIAKKLKTMGCLAPEQISEATGVDIAVIEKL